MTINLASIVIFHPCVKNLKKTRGALNALSSNLSSESMVTIYYSLAYSHVVQSVIIWGGASNTKINKGRRQNGYSN